MYHESQTIWNDAAVSSTQYAPSTRGLKLEQGDSVSFTVKHPAATTTDLTLQVSNMSDEDIDKGLDDWHDYAPTGYTAIPQQTGAATFGHQAKPGFARCRVKLVNSAGTGKLTIRSCVRKKL